MSPGILGRLNVAGLPSSPILIVSLLVPNKQNPEVPSLKSKNDELKSKNNELNLKLSYLCMGKGGNVISKFLSNFVQSA